MAVSDPIADMLTRIRNATMVGHESVKVPVSKLKVQIAEILEKEGFLESYEVQNKGEIGSNMQLNLHYWKKGEPAITGLERISKPGLRRYTKSDDLPVVYGNRGIAVISTNKGVMTGIEAKKSGVGGEVLFYIW
ncbi:30S ribosomal protein S8 [Chloroflexi bacterium]|nr:30S ribosomal protein S8 [Chloroflexota bacterium]